MQAPVMLPVNIPESRVDQKYVNISSLAQSRLNLLRPPSLLCGCDSVNEPIEKFAFNIMHVVCVSETHT